MTNRFEASPKIVHVGIVCESEACAARFYSELLGLEVAYTKTVPPALALPLFGIDADLSILNYVGPGAHFEIFIHAQGRRGSSIPHVCLEVTDLGEFVERAQTLGFPVTRVPRGDGWVTFIDDSDGNRFEIRQAPRSL